MSDNQENNACRQATTSHSRYYSGFNRTGKTYYCLGTVMLISAVVHWAVQMFLLFSEFHNKGLLELLMAPVFKFIANPLLWISVVFYKISQRYRPLYNESDQPSKP